MVIASNPASVCCVYKEKIVKKRLIPKNTEPIQIATYDSYRTQFNSKQIIQILQPKIIDNFSKQSYEVDIL